MSSNLPDSNANMGSTLPQCGFAADIDFDTLIKTNKFLFRVYTPKERSPFADDTEPFFLAPRFDEQVNRSPVDLPNIKFPETVVGSYAEVARHLEWTTRTSSSYISTSFSFGWAIWEAVKRYHFGIKKDVEIAVIDATRLGGRAATAVQLLNKSSPGERDEQFWKWHRFSEDSQSVLVYGMVPRTAVLASIPLLQVLRKMPSYFLHKDIQVITGNPLGQVAWDYMKRKLSYRHFCQDTRKLFYSRPIEVRLRDSTAGAVRLALSFLRPFFHQLVVEDFDLAISYLRTLAITISEWPGGVWVHEYPEVRQIVEAMALALGEELREKYSHQKAAEISRLRLVIDGLEQTIEAQRTVGWSYTVDEVEIDSDGDFELEFEESDEPTLVTRIEIPAAEPRHRRPLEMSVAVLPRIPISFQTPITPPDSPLDSLFLPTATATVVGTSSTHIFFKPPAVEDEAIQDRVASPLASSPSAEKPESPPPTPPPRSAVFSPLKLQNIPEVVSFHDVVHEDNDIEHIHDNKVADTTMEESDMLDVEPEKGVWVEDQTLPASYSHDGDSEEEEAKVEPDENVICKDRLDHHSEEQELELDSAPHFPTSHSWVAVQRRHDLASPLSSRRSSIMSVETLCEPSDLPLKRLSLATAFSDRGSFEFVPSVRSLGLASRTASFSLSDFSPRIRPATPTQVEHIDPLSIPLPASPVLVSPASSQDSIPLSLSRSTSTSGTSDSSESTERSVALITPLPPSPAISFDSLPSSLSRTSSSSSLAPNTELRNPHHDALPVKPLQYIIPPRGRISLLAPLSSQDDDDKASTRSNLGETASYLVTGFLVGAFITMFLFSTQRRTMLYLT